MVCDYIFILLVVILYNTRYIGEMYFYPYARFSIN